MSDAPIQTGPIVIYKRIEIDPAKGADKNLASIAELLDELQSSNLQSLHVPEPLQLYFGNEHLTDPSYRQLRISSGSRPPTPDEQKAVVFLTDVVHILEYLYQYLVQFKDPAGTNIMPEEATKFIEGLESPAYSSDVSIAAEKLADLQQLVTVLAEAAHHALGGTEAATEAAGLDSLTAVIFELQTNPRIALDYWEDLFLPLAHNLQTAPSRATSISLNQYSIRNTHGLVNLEFGAANVPQLRQVFHFFVLALRTIIKEPSRYLRSDITNAEQILTTSEIDKILSDSSLLFPEELAAAYTVAGAQEEILSESDRGTITAFLAFFADADRKIIDRLRKVTLREQPGGAGAAGAEEEGGEQTPPTEETPPARRPLAAEELLERFEDALVTAVIANTLGASDLNDLNRYGDITAALRTYVLRELAGTYLADWRAELNRIQAAAGAETETETETPETGIAWDAENHVFQVTDEYLTQLNQRITDLANTLYERSADDLATQLASLTLAQTPPLPTEEAPDTSLGAERINPEILNTLVANWRNVDTPLALDQRLQVTSSAYRRESIRLQNILINQFFNYYEIPLTSTADVPPELRRLFADEVEYVLRSKSPSELALLAYPGHRLGLLRQIFARVSHNPVFIERLQIVINQHADTLKPERLAEKAQNFENWVSTSLASEIDLNFDDLSYFINLEQQQQALIGGQADAYLERELKRLFSDQEADAVNAGIFLDNLRGLLKQKGSTEPPIDDISRLGGLYLDRLDENQRRLLLSFLHRYSSVYLQTLAIHERNTQAILQAALKNNLQYENGDLSAVGQAELENIQRTIDSLITLKKDPRFLETLNPDRFELIFRIRVTQQQLDTLIPQLVEYWKTRTVYWEEKLNVNNISQPWEKLEDEDVDQLKGRAGNEYFTYTLRAAQAVSDDMARVNDNEKVLKTFALQEAELDEELQKLRKVYLDNLKLETAGLMAANQYLAAAMEAEALYNFNQYVGPPQADGLVPGDPSPANRAQLFNPLMRLRKPSRGGILGWRRGKPKNFLQRWRDKAGFVASTALSDAVLPGSGVALRGLSKTARVVLGRRGQEIVEKLPLLGMMGIVGSGIATAIALSQSLLAQVFGAIGTALGGGVGGVLGTWGGFFLEKVGLGGSGGGLGNLFGGGTGAASGSAAAGQAAAGASTTATVGEAVAAKIGSAAKAASALGAPGVVVLTCATGLYINQLITNAAFLDPSRFAELVGETSPYVTVTKEVSPSAMENGQVADLTYTITITPKDSYIITPLPTETTDSITYLGGDALNLTVPIDQIREQLGDQPINPGESREITYTIPNVSGTDVQVTNTFNLIFMVTNEEGNKNAVKSAFVRIGNPQLGCFDFMPAGSFVTTYNGEQITADKDWTPEEIAKIQAAFSILAANPTYTSLLCSVNGEARNVELYRLTAGESTAYYGWAPHMDKIVLYDNALQYGVLSTRYTLTHELGHILDKRNSGLRQPGFTEVRTRNDCYSYPIEDGCVINEAFAEAIALFVMVPGYENLEAWNLQTVDPDVYNWILQTIFGGDFVR